MSSSISFFVSFYIGSLNDKIQSDIVIKHIWNLMYFFIIKCADLESIIFVINLDDVLSSKVLVLLIMLYRLYC